MMGAFCQGVTGGHLTNSDDTRIERDKDVLYLRPYDNSTDH